MRKLWITLIMVLIGASTALFAQVKNPQTMIQNRIAYMQENVELSGKESQTFWKVYEEYLKAEMRVMDTYRKNLEKREIKLGAPGSNKELIAKLSDSQLSYLQDQKFELRKNLLNLETTYYKKFKTILTPRHLQNLYDQEYKYKKGLTAKKQEVKKDDAGPVNTGKKKR